MARTLTYLIPFGKYPALRLALFFAGGILLHEYFRPPSEMLFYVAAVLILLWIIAELRPGAEKHSALKVTGVLIYLIIVGLSGYGRAAIEWHSQETLLKKTLGMSEWDTLRVQGEILNTAENERAKVSWVVRPESLLISGTFLKVREDLLIRVSTEVKATAGSRVEFSGIILPVKPPANPGVFNYAAYLKQQGINLSLKQTGPITFGEQDSRMRFHVWRYLTGSQLSGLFSERTQPVARALLLGDKKDLSSEKKKEFSRAGLSHIMAVSGLHVGFIIAPFWLCISFLSRTLFRRLAGVLLLILILFLYAGLTGFSPSVLRASVMAVFICLAKIFRKSSDPVNLTAAAAFVLLMLNPGDLFKVGFQLSFLAVLTILIVLPSVQQVLPYYIRYRWYGIPVMTVLVSVVVQLGLLPLQLYYFGEISLVSPLSNALFVPFLGIVIPLSLLSLTVSFLFPVAARWISAPAEFFLDSMLTFIESVQNLEWSWMSAGLPDLLLLPVWGLLIIFVGVMRNQRLRWKVCILIFCGIIALQIKSLVSQLDINKLEVIFFDVGQGDAALLKTPAGKVMLIDAGVWSPGYDSGRSVLIPYLKSEGISRLNALVLSHPHSDHIGGILSILNEFEVDTVYNSGFVYTSALYKKYLTLAGEKGVPVRSLLSGDRVSIDSTISVMALGPGGHFSSGDPNQNSVILRITYGEVSFLFTGDAGRKQEERLINVFGPLLKSDVLKAGHHGSKSSSSPLFMDAVSPELTVVSNGYRNKFRHPHKEAVLNIRRHSAKVLYTALQGAVHLKTDGRNLEAETFLNN